MGVREYHSFCAKKTMSEYPCLDISNSTASSDVFVLPEILALKEEVIANRRWFHANPELSFQEVKTAERIVEHLRSYGIEEIIEGVGRTGVVALIRGTANSNAKHICVALRADIDALPITETADIEYVSKNNGVMHACGHDGHMAGLLAAAKVLHNERHTFSGIVKLLFQPAEEGFHGAREMINDGCLEEGRLGPRVDEIYGIHIWTGVLLLFKSNVFFYLQSKSSCILFWTFYLVNKLGDVCCEVGPVMAASDRFCIEVRGAGGHGAAPQYTVDAIVEAATVVTSLQTIVSRSMDPLESAVLTCGTIQGGYGYNIVADHVRIGGTCRTFTKDNQEKMKRRMKEVCCGVAHMYGGDISLDYECMQ